MKKALFILAAIALVLWVASWFWNEDAVATSAARPWPDGMGTLDSVEKRFPQRFANDAARKLAALAGKLPKSEAVDGFVGREIERGELAIGKPPALPDVSAIRDLLLREPIVWDRREGMDGDESTSTMRALQMTAARALVASALAKAGAGDPAAWDDLRAVWSLARSLDAEPQLMQRTAAFAMARMINAVAWKMPLPAPAWLGELRQRDAVRPLLDGFQQQTASYWKSYSRIFPSKPLAESVERHRQVAEELSRVTQCDVKPPFNEWGPDLRFLWRRAFRYRAEREATANALRIRTGKSIDEKSVCSDGTWSFDGATLRFSRNIASAAPDTPMPLVLRVQP